MWYWDQLLNIPNMTPLLGTFSAGSVRAYRGGSSAVIYSGPTPEYWWRADSGLSTSAWNAYAGGLNFTLFNVTSADSATGVYFNGTNGYGTTSALASDISAKHIFVRTDSLDGTSDIRTILGNTRGVDEWYFTGQTNNWYIVEYDSGGTIVYASRNGLAGTKVTWTDLGNYLVPTYYADTDSAGTAMDVYFGTGFDSQFVWPSGFGMYAGRRSSGQYMQGYLKEIAIFTTNLTETQGKNFRSSMYSRWP
jgi:hypothetical protein